MNTYLFIELRRKGEPILHHTVVADNEVDAIQAVHYWPFNLAEDFDPSVPMDARTNEVLAYYGLIEGRTCYEAGNHDGDGYGTMLIEVIPGKDARVIV